MNIWHIAKKRSRANSYRWRLALEDYVYNGPRRGLGLHRLPPLKRPRSDGSHSGGLQRPLLKGLSVLAFMVYLFLCALIGVIIFNLMY